MPLINCPECGKEMSDTVKKCPNCGYREKKQVNWHLIISISLISIGIAFFIGSLHRFSCMGWTDIEGETFYSLDGAFKMWICFMVISIICYVASYIIISNRNKTLKRVVIGLLILWFCIPTYLFITTDFISNDEKIALMDQEWEQERLAQMSLDEKIKNVTNVEEAKKLLNGTTWHYTPNLSNAQIPGWIKVEFNGDKYTSYYARPADGKWTYGTSDEYRIEESRYNNTGGSYILVGFLDYIDVGVTKVPYVFGLDLNTFQLMAWSDYTDNLSYLNDVNTYGISGAAYRKASRSPKLLYGTMEFGDYNW